MRNYCNLRIAKWRILCNLELIKIKLDVGQYGPKCTRSWQ